jgi:predicted sulfurtransferase
LDCREIHHRQYFPDRPGLGLGGALLVPYLQQRGNKLSLLQATQMLNQGKVLVLDVRDAEQFAAGHLRDARNIP